MNDNKNNKKYGIKKMYDIKFYNAATGEEIKDIREDDPQLKKIDYNKPILELVKSVLPSYSIANHPLIKKYGYDTFGNICEAWYWKNSLNEASELELWKIYALIQSQDKLDYEYYYRKLEHEKYMKQKNEEK